MWQIRFNLPYIRMNILIPVRLQETMLREMWLLEALGKSKVMTS